MDEQIEKIKKLARIAYSGDKEAQTRYGIMLLNGGDCVVKDETEAFLLFKKAGGQDHPIANYQLGLMYLQNRYVVASQDYEVASQDHERVKKAWHFLTLAAEQGGIVDAMVALAKIGKEEQESFEFFDPYDEARRNGKKTFKGSCYWAFIAQALNHPEAGELVNYYESYLREQGLERVFWNARLNAEKAFGFAIEHDGNVLRAWKVSNTIPCIIKDEVKLPSMDEIIEKHKPQSKEQG